MTFAHLEKANVICSTVLRLFARMTTCRTVPYKVLVTVYYAFVHPHLLYGIEIYGNTHRSYFNKLMVLNNKLLRILQNAPCNTPVAD